MSLNPNFTIHKKPQLEPIDSIFTKPHLKTLLGSATVNPMGPTLEALLGDGDPNTDMSLHHMILNPFMQELRAVGDGYLGEPGYYEEAECFAPFFENFGSCPTLLVDVPGFIPEPEFRQPYLRDFLKSRPGARRVLTSLKKYPFDPFNRVGAEMQQMPHDPGLSSKESPLPDAHAEELLAVLLNPRHFQPELQAFLFAWKGAIEFQANHGNRELAAAAMPLKRFTQFYAFIHLAAGLPPC